MSLLDHFQGPLSLQRHWDGFHSAWAASIAQHLNQDVLPAGNFAEPHVQWGGSIGIDEASFTEPVSAAAGPTTTLLWSPPRSALKAPLRAGRQDVVEVRVFSEEGGPKLVAAIEIVSPANKDRPANRKAFAVKCASYLYSAVSVVVVDVVTTRKQSLHVALMDLLEVPGAAAEDSGALYAAAYRSVGAGEDLSLELWIERLALGQPLPALPLWLDPDTALPLDLDRVYRAALRALRIDGG
jgi:hypothetical protein